MENLDSKRDEIVKKWETLGLLDGLKGRYKGNMNLYEGCKRIVINEETGKTECCKEGINCGDILPVGILPVAVRLINELPPYQEIVTVIKKIE